jgi:hypothetical protein
MDIKTERRHYLNVPMVARYVRIHPLTWRRRIGLRVGILGRFCILPKRVNGGTLRADTPSHLETQNRTQSGQSR